MTRRLGRWAGLGLLAYLPLAGCSSDNDGGTTAGGGQQSGHAGSSNAGASAAHGGSSMTGGGFDPQVPPQDPAEVAAWLEQGFYKDWVCEAKATAKTDGAAAIHAHGKSSRVCSNVLLAASVAGSSFREGVAAVKEVYDADDKLMATMVSLKVSANSNAGKGWFFYGGPSTAGTGLTACTDCHGAAGSDDDHPGAGDYVYFKLSDEANLPPVGDDVELGAWLKEKYYQDWTCESAPTKKTDGASAIHVHGLNRVCSNKRLASATGADFEAGVASVKEIYDDNNKVISYDVNLKTGSDSAKGENWYWYGGATTSGFGIDACTGCHSAAASDSDHPGAGDFVYFKN